ncbi:D-alanyl-D-alanine carboxypeptidase/D-alanyl-D-alanine-endopeptidase [Solibacillus sp. MA9]|uniref:D-alanyl-D-alanine carboxypeptidase/D-alanyl-D-alanine-endopeptidase n=1 Tax=Solibacillus palustris TaxID=2908203 RepID=A0ABS9UHV9_9BACL|nr:D-alanyl-D-alanine carboxypeptidase/D-alanyl-D-alanine-endopeptidase [Solibacillus sp. MA9]MCH7323833.1 D-alanyl-D-alanine carboxypeptidase/D-alanyl-D-alanine-endopeptidase [Solibacillus sp. MA9]
MGEIQAVELTPQAVAALDQAVEQSLGKDRATFTLRDRATGDILYAYRGEHLMRPASNMKIISGAAALEELGLDYRFQTELYIDGELEDGMLNGNLYVKGYGDPTINEATLRHFADILWQKGIQSINGQLIGDDTYFTGDTLPPGVDDEGETHYYGARISPITMSPNDDFDASTIIVTADPQSVGEQPTFTVIPHLSGHEITNEATTVESGAENTLEIRRLNGTNQIVMTGAIPQGESAKVWVSLQNPTVNTLEFFKVLCEQKGIQFTQAQPVTVGEVTENAELIYTHESRTVAELFSIFMKLSNNSIADIFVKTLGKLQHSVGDYESGLLVVNDYLMQKNIDFSTWQFVDGSGLSHGIRLHANGISQLLFELQKEPYFEVFFSSLPVGGNEDRLIGGTLKDRFLEPEFMGKIFAKTGYIHEVHCLSGYATGASGKDYIFSIMLEDCEEGIPFIDEGLKAILSAI